MTIMSAQLRSCRQRQEDPTWTFARATVPELAAWVVVLTDDVGRTGLGYAHAIDAITGPSAGVRAGLDLLLPGLVGREAAELATLLDECEAKLPGYLSAKAAIDMALHDLLARQAGLPLHQLLGGGRRTVLPQARILSIKAPADMAANARRLAEAGYGTLKIKLSGDAEVDVARVAAIRDAAGPAVRLTLDPNQSYGAKALMVAFREMDRYRIDLIEQPVPADDWEGLKVLTGALPVLIEADETAGSVAAVWRLATERTVDCVNLKITKLGGLRNTAAAIRICEAAGIGCRFGAAFGPSLLQAFAAHIASTAKALVSASEMSEHTHLLDDPFENLPVAAGTIHLPDGSGCGISFRSS